MKYIGQHIFDYVASFRQNVGIGTDTPSEKLHVSGNAIITGDLTLGTTGDGKVLKLPDNGAIEFFNQNENLEYTIRNSGGGLNTLVFEANDGTDVLKLDNTNNATFANDVTVSGNLTVSGTTTTINTTDLNVEDKNITINYSTGDSSSTADGAGITIQDAVDSSTDATLLWNATADRFDFSHEINLPDNKAVLFGTDGDAFLKHTGSKLSFTNDTGDIEFTQRTDDGDIIFKSDDGSGGTAEYFRVDGGSEKTFYSKPILLFDSVALQLGTGTDATLYHSGGEGTLQNFTGNFRIIQGADNSDIQFFCDDGSGNVTEYFRLDGSLASSSVYTVWPDNSIAAFGSDADLRIEHTGSTASIFNTTGHLQIINYADDKDIIFKSDDGSGGVTTYFYLDGDTVHNRFSKSILLDDNVNLDFGGSGNTRIKTDGTDTFIQNYVGDFYIQQATDDKDIIFQCDDQSGGLTTYLTIDGSNGYIRLEDDRRLTIGSGNDLQLRHTSSGTFITNFTHDFNIVQQAADKDIVFKCDDGSGDVETYFFLDGSANTTGSPKTIFPDNSFLMFGNSEDLLLRHDGTDSLIQNNGGDFIISQHTNDKDLIFKCDDGSGDTTEYFRLDGGFSSPQIIVPDDVQMSFGTGLDLRIIHDGFDSYISSNGTGHLYIRQLNDDKDIIFQCDDGSGGLQTYFKLDGSVNSTMFPDSSKLYFGSGHDAYIEHDGTNTYLSNATGKLIIRNTLDDGDIELVCDDGSGGNAAYITLDGSVTTTKFSKNTLYEDSVRAQFGTGNDANIRHDGTDTYIGNSTGHFYIQQAADDKDLVFQSDNGSGGLTTYFFLDGSLANGTNTYTRWADNDVVAFGDSQDFLIYHDTSNTILYNSVGDIRITNTADDKDISFRCDDGSGGTTEYFRLDGSVGGGSTVHTVFPDNSKAVFGAGLDTQIWHDGTNSYIKQQGGGNLIIQQTAADQDIILQSDDGSGGETAYLTLDGSLTRTIANQHLQMADGKALYVGAGSDAGFYHLSGHNYIENNTGDLNIVQNTDDGDIIFKSDNGSGGIATYMSIDGGGTDVNFFKDTHHIDNVKAKFGSDSNGDLQIVHDSFDSYINNFTGHLYIVNRADDKDIVFRSDDGSGDVETYFFLDGSLSSGNPFTVFPDDSILTFGNSQDLQLKHSSGNSNIDNTAGGDLVIRQFVDDKDIIFQSDDGSGGTTTYFMLDGSEVKTIVNQTMEFQDNVKLAIGSSEDLTIDHNATNSRLINYTGNLRIVNSADDGDITFESDDNSGGVETYFYLDGGNNNIVFQKDIIFVDNEKAIFGSGSDLQIYHDGSNSFISHGGTGDLIIQQTTDDKDILFRCDDGTGSFTEYFRLDGGTATNIFTRPSTFNNTVVMGSQELKFADSGIIKLGDSNDLKIQHNGTDSIIANDAGGDLKIQQNVDDGDMLFQCDNGSGGTTTYFKLQGGAEQTIFNKKVKLEDSVELRFGNGNDMRLHHNGSNNSIESYSGNLRLIQNTDDGDIEFKCDDGSGGTTNYLTLDGSTTTTKFSKDTLHEDNVKGIFGTSDDLKVYHDSSNSYIENNTGSLYIMSRADDADLVLMCDDGSGGDTAYLTLDGGLGRTNIHKRVRVDDNIQFQLGSDGDIQFSHTGSIGYLYNNTGDFRFRQNADDKDFIFQCDDGSGGVTDYMRIDGSHSRVIFSDNIQATFGSSSRLSIKHDGTDATIVETQGDLKITNTANDKDIRFQCDDGSGGTTEYLRIDGDTVTVEVSKPINLASASSSASSGIYAQFINLKGFCTLAANYLFAEDLEDTKSPFEMAVDYGSATISSSTEINQSNLFRASGFHVPVACSVNAINMQLTCNNTGNVTIAVVEYRPSEAGTDQVDHPRTIYEEVVVASNDNNNKVKTVTVATADLDNTAIPAGSHIMIMAKGDSDSIGGKAFISAAIEIKW